VVGFKTKEFPAFFTPHSGFPASFQVDSEEQCAKLLHFQKNTKIETGIVIAVPIPNEYAAEGQQFDAHVLSHQLDRLN
jgi:pseudouridine-5'-phosphate glycosidase